MNAVGIVSKNRRSTHRGCDGHASRGSPEYMSWKGMWARCRNKGGTSYRYYGGRGIRVAAEWQDFLVFLRDMGPRPPGTTLDRIDANGHYERGNCRWADKATQSANLRSNRMLTIGGRAQHLSAWAREAGMPVATLVSRLRTMPTEDALAKPVQPTERLLTARGETHSCAEWARRVGLHKATLQSRLRRMTVEDALFSPVMTKQAAGASSRRIR